MRFTPAYLAAGLALCSICHAGEGGASAGNAPLSPIRQYLRDSLKLPPPAKPVESTAKPESPATSAPVVLPAFHVTERSPIQVFDQVTGSLAQKERLRSHALISTPKVDVLQPPTLEPGPAGTPRLKLNMLQLKW